MKIKRTKITPTNRLLITIEDVPEYDIVECYVTDATGEYEIDTCNVFRHPYQNEITVITDTVPTGKWKVKVSLLRDEEEIVGTYSSVNSVVIGEVNADPFDTINDALLVSDLINYYDKIHGVTYTRHKDNSVTFTIEDTDIDYRDVQDAITEYVPGIKTQYIVWQNKS